MDSADIPSEAASDAVMASSAEVQSMLDWTALAFTGERREGYVPRVELEVVRQDHNVLGYGQSCMETPIIIGKRGFEHGLGTHANSEIRVTVPDGVKRFQAFVGIDTNDDTQGTRGSVVFSVEASNHELVRTPVLRGSDEGQAIDIEIPEGAAQIALKVDTTEDGPSHDQADWADARFVMQDGSMRWLDENQSPLLFLNAAPPFSFTYDGKPSSQFLASLERKVETKREADKVVDTVQWTDPATRLCVTATVTAYTKYPAVDWVLEFGNGGAADTPIIEDIQALDVQLRTGLFRRPATLHQLEGDACGEMSFMPKTDALEAGKTLRLVPTGGRPSSISAFPFFNFQYRDAGLITAIGWTGQWCAQFDRAPNGPTRMRAGLEKTHLVLHPGERIRSPRIVLLAWQGDRVAAHNRFRRLVRYHYVPRLDGKPLRLPFALQTFDRYNARAGWATEEGQKAAVEVAHRVGCDTYWLDAAWFPGNFPNGVGNWFCKPAEFPNGLKPVSDLCHRYGMRFVLWFEPERVAEKSQIAEEHPEFVFGGKKGGLFKLNDPEARRFLTDLLSQRIDEYGIDVYRNDFNMDPLSFWRDNDAPDRQGITEIRYVEGLYAMWDELRERHPGLWIDNCSSGGRRIDIEMCSRSVPLWRSDTSCSPGHPEWNQNQTVGLGMYVPLFTACAWTPETYDFRSAATGGALCQFAYQDADFPFDRAAVRLAEAKENRKFWYGDFYPLTPCSLAHDQFMAYQFHRPDLDAGLVLAFRRSECNYLGLILGLQAIDPAKQYDIEFIDDEDNVKKETMSGTELKENLQLRIPNKAASLAIRYKAK